MQKLKQIGSWTSCINPFNNPVKHSFFRYSQLDVRFTQGDLAKICPICWFTAHKRNNPIASTPGIPINHRPDSKPEKDSL